MPYPLVFRQNTTATFRDNAGVLITPNVPMQLFRQMLALDFNRLPADWDGTSVPGGAILRFAAHDYVVGGWPIGPPHWPDAGFLNFSLDEDPNSDTWHVTDAVTWDGPGGPGVDRIISGFASKKRLWFGTTHVPAPGSANPDLTAPELEYGVDYGIVVPPFTKPWFRFPLIQAEGVVCLIINDGGAGSIRIEFKGGSPQNALAVSTSPIGANALILSATGTTPFNGLWLFVGFAETAGNNVVMDFIVRRGLAPQASRA